MRIYFTTEVKKHALVLTGSMLLLLLLSFMAADPRSELSSPAFKSLPAPILVIDAGHGGIDSGALGVDGSRESDINLAIALRIQALCDFYGLDSRMTRIDDSRASDASSYSEHGELVYRTELANSVPGAVFLSIHQNCYPSAQPWGSQVIFANNARSKHFAQILYQNLHNQLEPENRRLPEPDLGKIYVLKHVTCPAVLVECGFLSNHSDISKLTASNYQTALASVLTASYMQCFYNTEEI